MIFPGMGALCALRPRYDEIAPWRTRPVSQVYPLRFRSVSVKTPPLPGGGNIFFFFPPAPNQVRNVNIWWSMFPDGATPHS